MSQFRYIRFTFSTASSSDSASVSTMRLSTSVTSILYFVIQNAKITKNNEDLAIRSNVNKKDHNRSIKSNTNYQAISLQNIKMNCYLNHSPIPWTLENSSFLTHFSDRPFDRFIFLITLKSFSIIKGIPRGLSMTKKIIWNRSFFTVPLHQRNRDSYV